MWTTEAERRCRRWRRSASALLLVLLARPAWAGILHSESVLESQAAVSAAQRRLEFASSYYGAERWAGHRHLFRLAGSRGEQLQWSLTLPWLYSSLHNGGRTGRDNLQLGGALRLAGGDARRLRLGGELWLPFATDALAPLAERRASGRLALIGAAGAASGVEAALGYAWEFRGVGPETGGGPLPAVWSLDLAMGGRPRGGPAARLLAGAAWQPDPDVFWGWIGAGLAYAWDEAWLIELTGAAHFGAEDEASRADYRIRLGLRWDLRLPTTTSAEDSAGEAPAPDTPPAP